MRFAVYLFAWDSCLNEGTIWFWVFFDANSDLLFFFFFQAEDGIRDYKVTGVQTCALPISRRRPRLVPARGGGPGCARGPRSCPYVPPCSTSVRSARAVPANGAGAASAEIGRASCRERV